MEVSLRVKQVPYLAYSLELLPNFISRAKINYVTFLTNKITRRYIRGVRVRPLILKYNLFMLKAAMYRPQLDKEQKKDE